MKVVDERTDAQKLMDIIMQTLNYADPRLVDHGRRVARLAYNVAKFQEQFDKDEMFEVVILSILHDVGAYKTDDINNLVNFETNDAWEHSIYGYLFLENFAPISELRRSILFHHVAYTSLGEVPKKIRDLAQIIHIADRIDIALATGLYDASNIEQKVRAAKRTFCPRILDDFTNSGTFANIDNLIANDPKEFDDVLNERELSEIEIAKFVELIVLSIEFRSPQTVTHTVSTVAIADELAKRNGITSKRELRELRAGAMLHDIGKQAIPLEILESNGRLSQDEFEIMKSHVFITESILDGNVSQNIKNIAGNHHEKLSGNGYYKGLVENDLTISERIMAVADILSALIGRRTYKEPFSKEKIVSILLDMAEKNEIDREIVRQTVENFDEIVKKQEQVSTPFLNIYHKMEKDYLTINEIVKNKEFSKLIKIIAWQKI